MKNHLKAFLSLAIILVSGNISSNAQTYEPLADPSAVVTCGNARFTVLTPRLVRMEWAADGQFEDRATLAVVNRRLEVPQFRTQKKKDGVTIRTSDLTLTYKGNGNFTQENLKVEFTMADPKAPKGVRKVVWTPGADDSGNLLGTTRTLDGCDGVKTKEPYDKGILSRDGWAVLDESSRPVLREDDSDWKTWVEERNDTQRSDLYIFAYGHDYKQALADFTKVAGKIPLPPKYAFGYWWSRYWQYSDYEFIDLARMIRSMGVPMDVMVVDMDWHETWGIRRHNPAKDEFGQRIGWTGYTWQKELFPSPENFLQELHNLGLKTSLNLHPASGIQPYEECYDRFVKDYTSRTSVYDGPEGFVKEDGAKAPVPFRISEREWTDAYFNSVIHPLENQGVDFWWLDWQQWKYSKYMPSLNNTFWLNRTFFDDKVRRGESEGKDAERPMIY
ncbi:MAG: TIM-barrel domain-containing protein, partial [Candidatus Cryptobacteroides sp.]